MANNDLDKPQVSPEVPRRNSAAMALLTGSLALALAGNVFLLVRSSRLNDEISSLRDNTQAQFARLDSSVAAQQSDYKERLQAVNESVSNTGESATAAIQKARLENLRRAKELDKRLAEREQALTGEISSLKDDTTSKIAEVSTEVGSVKTDYGVAMRRSRKVSEQNSKGVEFLMKKNKITVVLLISSPICGRPLTRDPVAIRTAFFAS